MGQVRLADHIELPDRSTECEVSGCCGKDVYFGCVFLRDSFCFGFSAFRISIRLSYILAERARSTDNKPLAQHVLVKLGQAFAI